MACPMLTALDAVATAIQDAIDDASIDFPALRIVKTLRPRKALEEVGPDTTVIVYVSGMTSETNQKVHDEYSVTVACTLLCSCNGNEQNPHEQEREHAELSQLITDELRQRLAVSHNFYARPEAGIFDDATLDELNLLAATVSGTYRIMRDCS